MRHFCILLALASLLQSEGKDKDDVTHGGDIGREVGHFLARRLDNDLVSESGNETQEGGAGGAEDFDGAGGAETSPTLVVLPDNETTDMEDVVEADNETASEDPSSEPSGEEPSGEEPSGEEPSGEEPSGEEPSGEEPSGEEPSGEEPSGEEDSDEASSESNSTASTAAPAPAADSAISSMRFTVTASFTGFDISDASQKTALEDSFVSAASEMSSISATDITCEVSLADDGGSRRLQAQEAVSIQAAITFTASDTSTANDIQQASMTVTTSLTSFKTHLETAVDANFDAESRPVISGELTATNPVAVTADGGVGSGEYSHANRHLMHYALLAVPIAALF